MNYSELKEFLGLLSVLLAFAGYGAYYFTILKGRTRPHIFSWIVWSIVNSVVFFGQNFDDAGPGSWAIGITSLLCLGIATLGWKQGDRNITRTDWIAFLGALSTIPIWYVTKNPLGAVILATFIDVLGYYPTFRKAWKQPHDENILTWSVAALCSILSIFALKNYSLVTALFPIAMVCTNGGGACYFMWRRSILKATSKN